jgi:glycosyltransferase involved in cell wall biosynthesis
MVSRYVQPSSKLMNANVCRQAASLRDDHDVNVEILTWPFNDLWVGPVPRKADGCIVPPMRFEAEGLLFHIINPPNEWNERPPGNHAWNNAVAFGVRLLEAMNPDVVHLQHWFGLWWMLESAQRLGIPTVYSNHDWGVPCMRTILVMGDGSLCDGHLSVEKCVRCVWQGRGLIGRANELVAETGVGRALIKAAYRSPLKTVLEQREAVRLPLRERVALNLGRAAGVLSKLNILFTPSEFGRVFFSRLGVPADRIRVKPWYHDPIQTHKTINGSQPFTITYMGRVSPEKGVHLIFEALRRVRLSQSIQLRIAGANTSSYCIELQKKYATRVGAHAVKWLGWSDIEPLFLSTDVCIIPTLWIDNTPLSLIEALSYRVPVIATRVPPIEEMIVDGQNGYLAEYNSVESLAVAIERAVADMDRIRSGAITFPGVSTCREYTRAVKQAYLSITEPG